MTPRTLLALALGTALSGPAWASHGSALLTIDNEFDGMAQVFVDGRSVGQVHGDTVQNFAMPPGSRFVAVRTRGGFPLLQSRVHAHPRSRVRVEVEAPAATLVLRNTNHDRVWIQVDGRRVSLGGHQATRLRVESGDVDLVIERRNRFGRPMLERRSVWVEPASHETVALHGGAHGSAVAWHDDRWDRDRDGWHRDRDRWDRDDDDRWDRDRDDRWDRDRDDDDRWDRDRDDDDRRRRR